MILGTCVRIGDGSVRPPNARSPSYKEVASSSGISPAERHRGLPQVNLPGQAGPGSTRPINLNAIDITLDLNRPPDPRDAWPLSRVEEASRVITAYLRHGGEDKRYDIQGSDGYVRVVVFVQLPAMTKLNIDPYLIELVLKSPNPRIMMSDDGSRAIHTMARYVISDFYDEIKTFEEFRNHPRWAGRVPDHLVLEISTMKMPNPPTNGVFY